MVWRLVDAGWRSRYEPAVTVTHHPAAPGRRSRASAPAYGSSAAPLGRHHGAKVAPVRMSAWSLAVWALAVAGRPLAALATAAGTAAALVRKLRGVPAVESVRLAATGHAYAGRRSPTPCAVLAAGRAGTRARVPTGAVRRARSRAAGVVGWWPGPTARRRRLRRRGVARRAARADDHAAPAATRLVAGASGGPGCSRSGGR